MSNVAINRKWSIAIDDNDMREITPATEGHKQPINMQQNQNQHHQQQQQQQQQQKLTPQMELSLGESLKPLAILSPFDAAKRYQNENDEHNGLLFERMLQPNIGLNPFLNGNTYINDIIVQNTLLRGEGGR
jgi:hypothetical protein